MTKRYMKYIFFGTPKFATIVLEKLISAGLVPAAVVTNPDRPTGRNKVLTPPPVRTFVRKCERKFGNIDVLQPEELDASFAQQLESYNANVFIVAAYGKILPKWLIEMPPKKTVGVHPSLLPKYRGATPIQSAILNGDEETGVTIFLLDEKVDRGPTLESRKLETRNWNYTELEEKLAEEGGKLLAETLPKYVAGKIAPHPQDEEKATYTKKFSSEDGFVPYEEIGTSGVPRTPDVQTFIHRKIHALNPEPGVWTIKDGKRMKILEADLKDEKLVLKKIQYEGKKPTSVISE